MNDKLKSSLKKLDSAMQQADETTRDQLKPVKEHINAAIQSDASQPEQIHHDLFHALSDSVAQMESSHPQLTSLMNEVLSILSNYGI